MRTGRRFIGIEKDGRYFNVASKRIEDESRIAEAGVQRELAL